MDLLSARDPAAAIATLGSVANPQAARNSEPPGAHGHDLQPPRFSACPVLRMECNAAVRACFAPPPAIDE